MKPLLVFVILINLLNTINSETSSVECGCDNLNDLKENTDSLKNTLNTITAKKDEYQNSMTNEFLDDDSKESCVNVGAEIKGGSIHKEIKDEEESDEHNYTENKNQEESSEEQIEKNDGHEEAKTDVDSYKYVNEEDDSQSSEEDFIENYIIQYETQSMIPLTPTAPSGPLPIPGQAVCSCQQKETTFVPQPHFAPFPPFHPPLPFPPPYPSVFPSLPLPPPVHAFHGNHLPVRSPEMFHFQPFNKFFLPRGIAAPIPAYQHFPPLGSFGVPLGFQY